MDSRKLNENGQLKNFISNLRSGNLLKLIESSQLHFQKENNTLCTKLKQSEEEITKQLLILKQNAQLIKKFQTQLQELSNQNSDLLKQQQELKEENENLKNQLQCSEDKFAQLDIVYDQQVSVLTARIKELEAQLSELENTQNKSIDQFDQTQTELYEKLSKTEHLNADLERQLNILSAQQDDEKKRLQSEMQKVNELNETLTRNMENYEERIKDLQNNLAEAINENKQIIDLKNQIMKMDNNRVAEQTEYRKENSKLITVNKDLKLALEDLKRKLLSKEKETEEVYLQFKQLARFRTTSEHPPSVQSSRFSARKREVTDQSKPVDSSDSEGSTISLYQWPKKRKISTTDDEMNGFPRPINAGNTRKPNVLQSKPRNRAFPLMATIKDPQQQDIEIPESPVVSSSAFTNPEQKF